jgi:enoyl-CoA hydratase/carnithine racemase
MDFTGATQVSQTNNEEPLVLFEQRGNIATLTLNRPAQRNCLSLAVLDELTRLFDEVGNAARTNVIIVAANGPAFCSGHDLKEMTAARASEDNGRAFFEDTMKRCASLMQKIVHCPKTVIAAVQGIATAAGAQLVASCDLAIASDTARFATPGVHLGLFCSTPMVALSRNLSRKRAMEMLLTGDMIPAADACAWGLVNRVVPAAELQGSVQALAEKIAAKSSITVKIGKEAFYRQLEMGLAEAYDYASRVMVENMLHREAVEGIGAFLEKREPQWSDR